MFFVNYFKRQNLAIQVGFIALVISLFALLLGLILIGTANFVPKDSNVVNPNLIGNGFTIISNNGISQFLTSQGYADASRFWRADLFTSAPLAQLVVGIIFLCIALPTFGAIAIILLSAGYFKRWLYT